MQLTNIIIYSVQYRYYIKSYLHAFLKLITGLLKWLQWLWRCLGMY